MSTAIALSYTEAHPKLHNQTVIVVGGGSCIGLEVARQARNEGARLILTGRDPSLLQRAAREMQALSTPAFDATDPALLDQFFRGLPPSIDHVIVVAEEPCYGRIIDMDYEGRRRALSEHLMLFAEIARNAASRLRPGGTLVFISVTGNRRPVVGYGVASTLAASLPALTSILAQELAPIRVNLIGMELSELSPSSALFGKGSKDRRQQLPSDLPPYPASNAADVAALAVQIMNNVKLTGTAYEFDSQFCAI